MRSKLFVPGSRPELFDKALASDADALSFDLEDSVPWDSKANARAHLSAFLQSDAARASKKTLIVRVNALGTPHLTEDFAALKGCAVGLVNLPKIEAAEQVHAVAELCDLPLLLTVETPKGVRSAADIAAAHPRVAGLQAGLNDLFVPLDMDRRDPANVHAALFQLRLAAGEAGCFAYDGAWPDLDDLEGFQAEAKLARRLGFRGKSCIHPRQVPVANAVFGTADTLADARRLLSAADGAVAKGHGAFAFEGRMVDRPEIDRARALVAAEEGSQ